MRAGETPVQSAARLLARELNIKVNPHDLTNRFSSLGHFSFQWARREQPPKENGTADISVVLCVELSEADVAQCVLDTQEYEESKWESPENVLADQSYHPALRRVCAELIRQRVFRKMACACADAKSADRDVALLCREYVRMSEELNRQDRDPVMADRFL